MMQEPEIALGIGARSEKGRREENQDKMTAFSTSLGTFYIVADGMGGHRGGAEAAHKVVEGYRKHLAAFHDGLEIGSALQQATAMTNAEILAESRSGDPAIAGMGSTVVLAMLRSAATGMEVLTAHIGDSRAYMLRGGVLTQLTHDHSAVQRMVDEQLISAENARTHPDLNVLTRALGKQTGVELEIGPILPLRPGEAVLLCTDGLWGHLTDDEILREMSVDRNASETADALVQLALDRGSDDNITLQLLRLEDRANAPALPLVTPAQEGPPESGPGRITEPSPVANLETLALRERVKTPAKPAKTRGKVLLLSLLSCIVAVAVAFTVFFVHQRHAAAARTVQSAPIQKPPCKRKSDNCASPVSSEPVPTKPAPAVPPTPQNPSTKR